MQRLEKQIDVGQSFEGNFTLKKGEWMTVKHNPKDSQRDTNRMGETQKTIKLGIDSSRQQAIHFTSPQIPNQMNITFNNISKGLRPIT